MPRDKKKSAQAGLSFEPYGRAGSFEAEPASSDGESLKSLLTRLKFDPDSQPNYPPPVNVYEESGEGQAYPFEAKKIGFRELKLYVFVGIVTAALSGVTFVTFFYLLSIFSVDNRIVRTLPKERQTGPGLSIHQPGFVLRGRPVDRESEDAGPDEPDVQSLLLRNGSTSPAPIVDSPPDSDRRAAIYGIGQDEHAPLLDPRNGPEPIPSLESGERPGRQPTQISPPLPASNPAQPLETERPKVENNPMPAPVNKSGRKLRPGEEEKMLTRASDMMKQNDITSARLIYKYLEEHGSVAAKSLNETTGAAGGQGGFPR